MKTKSKIIFAVGVLAIGGIAFFMYKKNKDAQAKKLGGGTSGGGTAPSQCLPAEQSKGKGKGVYLSIAGGTKNRQTATDLLGVGTNVVVDGVPTTIIKVWKDKNKRVGAIKLENGVSNGLKICW